MKLNLKYLIILVLILIILLGTFYSEGMSAYVMKNAFIQNDTGAGRLTTIDTDGNFTNEVSDVEISIQSKETTQPK